MKQCAAANITSIAAIIGAIINCVMFGYAQKILQYLNEHILFALAFTAGVVIASKCYTTKHSSPNIFYVSFAAAVIFIQLSINRDWITLVFGVATFSISHFAAIMIEPTSHTIIPWQQVITRKKRNS